MRLFFNFCKTNYFFYLGQHLPPSLFLNKISYIYLYKIIHYNYYISNFNSSIFNSVVRMVVVKNKNKEYSILLIIL